MKLPIRKPATPGPVARVKAAFGNLQTLAVVALIVAVVALMVAVIR